MNLAAVMDEIAAALAGITGLRVSAYPPGSVSPPAGIVSYPDEITYNLTSGPTGARIESLPVVLVAGKATDRAAREAVSGWASTDGPASVKAVLEEAAYASLDTLTVTRCGFDVVTIAGVDYLAATFDIDISGH